MYALATMPLTGITCGHFATTSAELDELVALAEEKGALFWKAVGMGTQGLLFSMTGRTSEAVRRLLSRFPPTVRREQSFVYRGIYQIWQVLTQTWANSVMLSAALLKP
jgi:hypothetical protein